MLVAQAATAASAQHCATAAPAARNPAHCCCTVPVVSSAGGAGQSGGISRATIQAALFRVQCHWQAGSLGAVTTRPGRGLCAGTEAVLCKCLGVGMGKRLRRFTGRAKFRQSWQAQKGTFQDRSNADLHACVCV